MYYISENKIDLENYNQLVNNGENYNGTTNNWGEVIKHFELELYAIIINDKYTSRLEVIENLDGWFNENII
jgi:hypothetical protein